MRQRDPFRQALIALRQSTTDGRLQAGGAIVIADEARRLGLSTTPVREALCWMGGEGLVERGAAGGFFAPRLDAAVLAQRYAFRSLCLVEMSARVRAEPPAGLIAASSASERLLEMWFWKVRSLGDVALFEAFARVQAHLARFAAVEARFFEDLDGEAEALLAGRADADTTQLIAFHRRRIDVAALLVLAAEADADPLDGEGGT